MIASTVALMDSLLLLLLASVSYVEAIVFGEVTTTAGGGDCTTGAGGRSTTEKSPPTSQAEISKTKPTTEAVRSAGLNLIHPTVQGAGQDARAV
jgi:hypothetical protein